MDLVKDIQRQLPNTVEINDAVLDDLDTLGGGKQEEDMQMTLGRILSGHIWSTLVAKIGADLHGKYYHAIQMDFSVLPYFSF